MKLINLLPWGNTPLVGNSPGQHPRSPERGWWVPGLTWGRADWGGGESDPGEGLVGFGGIGHGHGLNFTVN